MSRILAFFLALLLLLTGYVGAAHAQSFEEALATAYATSPTVQAERARLQALDTTVPAAQSGWRPSADLRFDGGIDSASYPGNTQDTSPRGVTLSVVQPVWRGGRTVAATDAAKDDVMAGRARLRDAEQSVLLDAATSYIDVMRDRQVLALNRDNESALERQLDSVQHRFDAGELTVTDVRQAESRLAAAQADTGTATASLDSTAAAFTRATGLVPGDLVAPQLGFDLPGTRDETVRQALGNNPQLDMAKFVHASAISNIDVARGALLPEAQLRLDLSRSWHESALYTGDGKVDEARLVGSLVVPLYRSGIDYARLAGAHANADARQHELSEAERKIEAQAIGAWSGYQAAISALRARSAQVAAAQAALEGMEMENKAGTRTITDVLDAQQEWRNSRVSQVTAARNIMLARLELAAITGRLTPEALSLQVPDYDPIPHYNEMDGNWFAGQ